MKIVDVIACSATIAALVLEVAQGAPTPERTPRLVQENSSLEQSKGIIKARLGEQPTTEGGNIRAVEYVEVGLAQRVAPLGGSEHLRDRRGGGGKKDTGSQCVVM